MINVAWQIANTEQWTGGLNYFRNLLEALLAQCDRKVNPVLLGENAFLPPIFSSCQTLPGPRKMRGVLGEITRFFRKRRQRRFDDGGELSRYLQRNDIGLLSHGQVLGRASPVPALCWIPDFQHIHLANFFQKEELRRRDASFKDMIERSQALLFSSEAARKDCDAFLPGFEGKSHVLHFVASVSSLSLPSREEVFAKYKITTPFFHVPNQLWAHKNHGIIRDALQILKNRGNCPVVISTGLTDDYRNPGYFAELKDSVEQLGLAECFRFLGLIPYADMQVLMRASMALINPSLFEGWSSTVEEGKSLGKRILLSEIPVHREQAPERGEYFPSNNPEALAKLLVFISSVYTESEEEHAAAVAAEKLPSRLREFALRYERIVESVVSEYLV